MEWMRALVFILIASFFGGILIALPCFFVFEIVRSARQARADKEPLFETSAVRVIAKYTEGGDNAGGKVIPLTYHVTFEDEDGTRRRFTVPFKENETLKGGDRGALTRQGTDYKGFVRTAA